MYITLRICFVYNISYPPHAQVLENVKVSKEMDRETLICVARTSLCTKLSKQVAAILTEVSASCKHYTCLASTLHKYILV